MRQALFAGVGFALLTFAAAQAQTAAPSTGARPALDQDQDGRISRGEVVGAALARFDRADADRNGTVTIAERRAVRTERRAAAPARKERALSRLDADNDGKVTRVEFDEASEAARQRRFARADLNRDGVWDQTEIRSLAARFEDGQKRRHGGRRAAAPADLTRAEAERRAGARFDRADADRNGYLSQEERPGLKAGRGERTGP